MEDDGHKLLPWHNMSCAVDTLMPLWLAIFAAVDLQFVSSIPLSQNGNGLLALLFSLQSAPNPTFTDIRSRVYHLLERSEGSQVAEPDVFGKSAQFWAPQLASLHVSCANCESNYYADNVYLVKDQPFTPVDWQERSCRKCGGSTPTDLLYPAVVYFNTHRSSFIKPGKPGTQPKLKPVVRTGPAVYKLVSCIYNTGRGNKHYSQMLFHHCCSYLHDGMRQSTPKVIASPQKYWKDHLTHLEGMVFVRVDPVVSGCHLGSTLGRLELEKTLSLNLMPDVQFVNAALESLLGQGWNIQRAHVNQSLSNLGRHVVAAHVDQKKGHMVLVCRLENIVFVYNTCPPKTVDQDYIAFLKPLLGRSGVTQEVHHIRAHKQPLGNYCGLTTVHAANQIMNVEPLDTNFTAIRDILQDLQPCVPDLKRLFLSVLLRKGDKPPPVPIRGGRNKDVFSHGATTGKFTTVTAILDDDAPAVPESKCWCVCGSRPNQETCPEPRLHCRSCGKQMSCPKCTVDFDLKIFVSYVKGESIVAFSCGVCEHQFEQCDTCMAPVCCLDCMQDLPYRSDDYTNPPRTCKGCSVSPELCHKCQGLSYQGALVQWREYVDTTYSAVNNLGFSLQRDSGRDNQVLMYTTHSVIPQLAPPNFAETLEATGMYVLPEEIKDLENDLESVTLREDCYYGNKTGASFRQIENAETHATLARKAFSQLAGGLLNQLAPLRRSFGTAWVANPTTVSVFDPGPSSHVQFPGPAFWLCFSLEPGEYSTLSSNALVYCKKKSVDESRWDIRKILADIPLQQVTTGQKKNIATHKLFVCAASAPFLWHSGGKRLQIAMTPESLSSMQDLLFTPGTEVANCPALSIIPLQMVDIFTDSRQKAVCVHCQALSPVYLGTTCCANCLPPQRTRSRTGRKSSPTKQTRS
jgi:hypothetical protein